MTNLAHAVYAWTSLAEGNWYLQIYPILVFGWIKQIAYKLHERDGE